MRIKICGITTFEDALAAVDTGADMLGFNFYPKSKRYITPRVCAEIQAELRACRRSAIAVGVFVNAPYKTITKIMNKCALDLAQLHGDESPALLEALGERAFKAIRPRSVAQALAAKKDYIYREGAPTLLVDAYHPEEYGGTGQTGNWALARELASDNPIFLAGGLHPGNVHVAIEDVRPWGVDVASGVESSPRVKDTQKMRDFVHAARPA